tara:strand:- start:654 stop:854 length:201 start_codon:yes stop_codon:yes gene_type:complete
MPAFAAFGTARRAVTATAAISVFFIFSSQLDSFSDYQTKKSEGQAMLVQYLLNARKAISIVRDVEL